MLFEFLFFNIDVYLDKSMKFSVILKLRLSKFKLSKFKLLTLKLLGLFKVNFSKIETIILNIIIEKLNEVKHLSN